MEQAGRAGSAEVVERGEEAGRRAVESINKRWNSWSRSRRSNSSRSRSSRSRSDWKRSSRMRSWDSKIRTYRSRKRSMERGQE